MRILREGRAQSADEALDVLKADLKALTADVQVEQEEYDEVVVIKPLFLVIDYQERQKRSRRDGTVSPAFCYHSIVPPPRTVSPS